VPGILRRVSANSYIEAAVAAHRSSLNGSLPLEIRSESPSVVTAWFAGVKCLSISVFPVPLGRQDMGNSTG